MISPASAASLAATLPPERLRSSVPLAILDGRILQPDARGDSQPEDLAAAILSGTPGVARDAILAGCRDVCAELLLALAQSNPAPSALIPGHELPISEVIAHFGALINRTAPPELAPHTKSLLQLVLRPEIDRTLRGPLVRAALAYAHSESEVPFWEPLVASELIPVWAFKALVQINPRHPRIVSSLASLWIRWLQGKLQLNVSPLTRDLSRQQDNPAEFLTLVRSSVETAVHSSEHFPAFIAEWKNAGFGNSSTDRTTRSIYAELQAHFAAVAKPAQEAVAIAKPAHKRRFIVRPLETPGHCRKERGREVKALGALISAALIRDQDREHIVRKTTITNDMIRRLMQAELAVVSFDVGGGAEKRRIHEGARQASYLKASIINSAIDNQPSESAPKEISAENAYSTFQEELGNPSGGWDVSIQLPSARWEVIRATNANIMQSVAEPRTLITDRVKAHLLGGHRKGRAALRFSVRSNKFVLHS